MIINNIDFEIKEDHPILHLSEIDKAYIAGLVDGEGCFGLYKTMPTSNPLATFTIGMTDEKIIRWLFKIIGYLGDIQERLRKGNRKDIWQLRITSNQCLLFTSSILPYLKIKDKQARIIIQHHLIITGRSKYQPYSKEEQEGLTFLQMDITKLNQRGK